MRTISLPTRRQWIIISAVVVGVLLVGGVAVAGALALRFDEGVDRVEVAGLNGGADPAADPDNGEDDGEDPDDGEEGEGDNGEAIPAPDADRDDTDPLPDPVDEVVTVLVAASDDRSVLSPEEQSEFGTGAVPGERTEALALARLDPVRDRVDVLRIPRDSVVERCDGSVGRINAAYALGEERGTGGPTCLVETVDGWTGVTPDHFVMVDFRGFVDIVDAIGGVEVWIDEPIEDDDANLDVGAGCQLFDGQEALAFARARSIDNDFGRIARQQRLVQELRDEVVSGWTAANPRRLVSLIDAAAGALQVDESMTLSRMRELAAAALDIPGDGVHSATVPGTISQEPPYVLHVDDADLTRLVDDFVAGQLQEDPAGDAGEEGTADSGDDTDTDPEASDRDHEPGDDSDEEPEFVGVDRGPGCD